MRERIVIFILEALITSIMLCEGYGPDTIQFWGVVDGLGAIHMLAYNKGLKDGIVFLMKKNIEEQIKLIKANEEERGVEDEV